MTNRHDTTSSDRVGTPVWRQLRVTQGSEMTQLDKAIIRFGWGTWLIVREQPLPHNVTLEPILHLGWLATGKRLATGKTSSYCFMMMTCPDGRRARQIHSSLCPCIRGKMFVQNWSILFFFFAITWKDGVQII